MPQEAAALEPEPGGESQGAVPGGGKDLGVGKLRVWGSSLSREKTRRMGLM